MNMKSKLFGSSAKLALTLLAMCGMFASCYEKDEIDVPKVTEPTATTYQVAGIVTDAESNAVMEGVTVTNVTNSKSMTTAADGKYALEAKVGETNVVTFAKSGYMTVTSSVFVTKQENGSIVAYTIDAKMEKGSETKPTKDVEYQIEGSVFDAESGDAVTIQTATIPGVLTATIDGNKFTMSNVSLGQHTVYITADGYKPTSASVVISEVAGPEGEGVYTVTTPVTIAMQKKEVEVAPKYYLSGNVYNQDGGMVTKAEVTLSMTGYETVTTASNGFYRFEIPADKVKGLTKASVTIRHNSYKLYVYTAFIAPVDNGQVSNTTVNVTLILKPDTEKPADDDNVFIGGNVDIELPTENAVEAVPEKEEGQKVPSKTAVEESINKVLEAAGSEIKITPAQAEQVVNTMEKYIANGTLTEVDKIAVLPIEKETTFKLESKVIDTKEDTEETVIDEIVLPANTVVIFTSGVASTLNISRTDEGKEGAAIREYEGTPTGTIFVTPMEVKFTPAVVVAQGETPEVALATLYFNEKTNVWEAEENYATFQNGAFVGNVHHFSKFKFGFEEATSKATAEAALDTMSFDKACYTEGETAKVQIEINWKGGIKCVGGASVEEIVKKAHPTLTSTTIKMIASALEEAIKDDNANVVPGAEFTAKKFTETIEVPAYTQLLGFKVTRNEIQTTYSLPFAIYNKATKAIEKKTAEVTISKVSSVVVNTVEAIGHGHGHGHGNDLNAGGGIIISE